MEMVTPSGARLKARSFADEPPLLRRLRTIAVFEPTEVEAIVQLPMTVREVGPRIDLVREGDTPKDCFALLEGFVIRYKISAQGDRRIIAVHVPGEIPDLQCLHLERTDHGIASLTAVRVGWISHRVLHDLNQRFPRIAGALWRACLVDASIFREWIINLGHRDALSRTAHFLCELQARLSSIGQTEGEAFELPLTQSDLADALGMSAVHMNRTFQELRARRLIEDGGRTIVGRDWPALRELGEFDAAYLHMGNPNRPNPA